MLIFASKDASEIGTSWYIRDDGPLTDKPGMVFTWFMSTALRQTHLWWRTF